MRILKSLQKSLKHDTYRAGVYFTSLLHNDNKLTRTLFSDKKKAEVNRPDYLGHVVINNDVHGIPVVLGFCESRTGGLNVCNLDMDVVENRIQICLNQCGTDKLLVVCEEHDRKLISKVLHNRFNTANISLGVV